MYVCVMYMYRHTGNNGNNREFHANNKDNNRNGSPNTIDGAHAARIIIMLSLQ